MTQREMLESLRKPQPSTTTSGEIDRAMEKLILAAQTLSKTAQDMDTIAVGVGRAVEAASKAAEERAEHLNEKISLWEKRSKERLKEIDIAQDNLTTTLENIQEHARSWRMRRWMWVATMMIWAATSLSAYWIGSTSWTRTAESLARSQEGRMVLRQIAVDGGETTIQEHKP